MNCKCFCATVFKGLNCKTEFIHYNLYTTIYRLRTNSNYFRIILNLKQF